MNNISIDILQIIGISVVIIPAILGGVNYLLKKSFREGKNSQRFFDVESKVGQYNDIQINCEKRFVRIEHEKANLSDVQNKFNELLLEIKEIKNPSSKQKPELYITSRSPLTLTKDGIKKTAELGIDTMINTKWNHISAYIDKNLESKNPYDIQKFCFEKCLLFPEEFFNKEELDKLKHEAYREGVSIDSYMRMVAILVNEKYLQMTVIS